MNLGKLKERLRWEILQYLADLRQIREDLRNLEGWIALALTLAVLAMGVVWFFVSLGFSPPNDSVASLLYRFGQRPCRPIDNFGGVIVLIDFFLLAFLAVVTLGNVFNIMQRVRTGQRRNPRPVIVSTSLMLAVGIGGIVFMRNIC